MADSEELNLVDQQAKPPAPALDDDDGATGCFSKGQFSMPCYSFFPASRDRFLCTDLFGDSDDEADKPATSAAAGAAPPTTSNAAGGGMFDVEDSDAEEAPVAKVWRLGGWGQDTL